jgi:hypothetical protein
MPSTAPALTWQMTNLRSPATENVTQDVMDAIALAVGDSTTWRVVTSGAGFLELGPVVNSPTTDDYVNFRVIIAFGIDAAQRQEPHDSTAVNAGELWMGIAPEGGSVGIIGAGPLTAADPYSVRWSLYWRISDIITGNGVVNQLFCLTSDEIFSVWLNDMEDVDWWGGLCGAMIDPPTDADGEGTPGRVYGMAVTGRTVLSGGFWSEGSGFLNSHTTGTGNVIGCFRPALTTRWTVLDRSLIAGQAGPRATTEGGTRLSIPMEVWQAGITTIGSSGGVNPLNCIGILRQIRWTQDGVMREIVEENTGGDQSYYVSAHSTTNNDAASFDNG